MLMQKGWMNLSSYDALSAFLASVERRAFRQALYAVQNEDAALDLVQDAMMRLAERYAENPVEELPMLFQRILQNAIRDYYRRSKVRSGLFGLLLGHPSKLEDDDDVDPLDTMEIEPQSEVFLAPDLQLSREQTLAALNEAVQQLPRRQREAFLLRYWEEMDVAETATTMGCSEGSVKTHCSRATHALAAWLKAKGVAL